ncbi:sulfotransferase [bacterium]|nr:sulfotransferase [bacterium]
MDTDQLEHELIELWKEVLHLDNLHRDDPFESLGGTPALGGRLIERLEKRFALILHLPWLVAAPTVAQQAAWLQRRCFVAQAPQEGMAEPQAWRDYFAGRFTPDPHEVAAEGLNPPALFVLSAARTGSTLLRIMLAGHPQLFSPPELELLLFPTMQQRKHGLLGGWSDFLGLERALMELSNLDEFAARAQVSQMVATNLSTQQVYRTLQHYCAPRLLVDKSPSYPISRTALARLGQWFESVKVIHLVRHPLACVRSWTASNFDQVFHAPPRQAAEMDWLLSNENIELACLDRHLVRYEDLVTEPAMVMREISEFVQIDFHSAMLTPYEGQRMTERLCGLVSGDKRFYQKSAIDPAAAQGSRRQPGDGPLSLETEEMARRYGYTDL